MQFPAPAWSPRRFLHHHQEWPKTSPSSSATSRRYGRQPAAPEWSWTLSKMHVVKMIGGGEKKKRKHMVFFASSWVKHRWMRGCCNLGQWMSKTWVWVIVVLWHRYDVKIKKKQNDYFSHSCCSILSCPGSRRASGVSPWQAESCLRQHSVQYGVGLRQHAQQELYLSCVRSKFGYSFRIIFFFPYKTLFSSLIRTERGRRWSGISDKDKIGMF